jgi:glycerol-1-phosphate dehydrogenase [NAD(P)+]
MKSFLDTITLPVILNVGKDNLGEIGGLIAKTGYSNIILFFGPGIYNLIGDKIVGSLRQAGLNNLENFEPDDNQIDCLMNFAFSIPNRTQLILGIGGGKVLDVAKYVGFLNDIPFVSIPTSPSNDGFSSSGCSLVIDGKRKSVPAKMPYGIVVDIDVIKNVPEAFIYSGIGDLVSKITAVYDWRFEAENGHAEINDFAVMIAKKSVNSVVRMDHEKDIRNDFFLKELMDSLTMSGIAMEIAKNSAPASGSEHLISHALDSFLTKPYLHGIQVGVATYIMSMVQDHRHPRVKKFLTETGFFAHIKDLKMQKADFAKAIDIAPTIKPHRHTFIHLPEYRDAAKKFLDEDEILNEVLV